jgi:aryl-alcohol dehydrogenase-like predicted oxidoreductase
MKFHRRDWRRNVFRGDLLRQTVRRVSEVKSLIEPTTSLAQVALQFCLGHPAVTAVIPGARNPEQVKSDLAAGEQGPLSPELLEHLTRLWRDEFRYNVRTSIGEEGEG